ncbi:GerMN domain-containing protein [Paenibacillus glycinis]|uniref:GerMN domain-containing protein n=1 Tax=Paenibacillus glycinis TaxID=2697035 RepID=A0ABW9XUW7_9BACL|nr:GerMN domain-containing protein [Paenibacillus glycinis]NBD26469.1 hypothetical protein [Paenibacillus glycinis]
MKRQMTKTVMLVSVAAALVVSLSACGAKKQPAENAGANNQNQSVSENGNGSTDASTNAGNAGNANNANNAGNAGSTGSAGNAGGAADSGNASDPATTAPEKTKASISVYYTDDQMIDLHAQKAEIEYADASEKLSATFAALQKDGDKGEGSLWKNAELLSAKQDGDAVTIDVHLPDDARLGAPGEQLAIAAITQTYFQFDGVASLDILVDGEAVESLMGHEDLEHPIKKQ